MLLTDRCYSQIDAIEIKIKQQEQQTLRHQQELYESQHINATLHAAKDHRHEQLLSDYNELKSHKEEARGRHEALKLKHSPDK